MLRRLWVFDLALSFLGMSSSFLTFHSSTDATCSAKVNDFRVSIAGEMNQVINKMQKSIVVAVDKLFYHKIFNRYIKCTSKFMAHDKIDHCNIGDRITVTFVLKDREEKLVNVLIGMSMLEAAHANDVEIDGACASSLVCETCLDIEFDNKLEKPCDDEKSMTDHAHFMSESPRLGCQVIAKRELDGIRLALPVINRHFTLRGSDKYKDDNYQAL